MKEEKAGKQAGGRAGRQAGMQAGRQVGKHVVHTKVAGSCKAAVGRVMSCHVMSCHVMLGAHHQINA